MTKRTMHDAPAGSAPAKAVRDRLAGLLEQLIAQYGPALAELLIRKLLTAVGTRAADERANEILRLAMADSGGGQTGGPSVAPAGGDADEED